MNTLARLATAFAVLVAGALFGSPAAAQTSGCGYGTGGDLASTICWIDMSDFDQTTAMSPAGQSMSIELTPDYSMSFTFKVTPGADGYRVLQATAFPTYAKAPIGNTAYIGTPGKPALYQQVDAGTGASGDLGTLTVEDLVVTGPSGAPVNGYGIVMADAETTNRQEGLTFSSDQPIEELTRATMPDAQPACGGAYTGLGTTSVTCNGDTAGGLPVDEIVLYSVAPTTASIGFLDRTANAVQGVAFGILTAKVGMDKTVENQVNDTDSFGMSIEDGNGAVIEEGSTGGGDSGTIDSQTILASRAGRVFTLSETAEGDTDLAAYTQDWTCTNHGAADDALPTGDGTSLDVRVSVGDDIRCTIVNTGPTPVDPTPDPGGSEGPSDPGGSDYPSGDGSPSPDAALPVTGGSAMLYSTIGAIALVAALVGWLMVRRARKTAGEWPSV
ncbi:CshA/CshB family fibrillar adhesin-related protein [Glycomyces sp. YM15]|uniref:CshA/CshB family fibrillar adhesin-related protein n=1 Tax=Glycomyces sp. YM15 TaxID=2800446 RepID=UPI001963F5FA|nr:CshA/CshB family fibrillar adhesin-related protein [Glycomyces sp. YM15]